MKGFPLYVDTFMRIVSDLGMIDTKTEDYQTHLENRRYFIKEMIS